jgi:hypothetical protein
MTVAPVVACTTVIAATTIVAATCANANATRAVTAVNRRRCDVAIELPQLPERFRDAASNRLITGKLEQEREQRRAQLDRHKSGKLLGRRRDEVRLAQLRAIENGQRDVRTRNFAGTRLAGCEQDAGNDAPKDADVSAFTHRVAPGA